MNDSFDYLDCHNYHLVMLYLVGKLFSKLRHLKISALSVYLKGFYSNTLTRMWADAQRDGRPAEYRWRHLRKFRNSIPCTTPQSLADPAFGVPCSNATNIGEHKTWTQSEFCMWRNSVRGQELWKCIYIVYQPRRRPNIVQSLVGLPWMTLLQ